MRSLDPCTVMPGDVHFRASDLALSFSVAYLFSICVVGL
jgi:hypothetical protein